MDAEKRIGQIVGVKTGQLPSASSNLAARALADLALLDIDPRLRRLVDALRNSGKWPERVAAWEQIRMMGPSVRGWKTALVDLIFTADGWSRIFAAESLANHASCPGEAVPVLLAALEATLEVGRFEWARMACGAIGRYTGLPRPLAEQAVQTLMKALETSDPNVAAYAALALRNWGSRSEPALCRLAELCEKAHEPFKTIFLQAMQKIDPSILNPTDALVIALDSRDDAVRAQAVSALGRIKGTAAAVLPHLLALHRDESAEVRKRLALTLGRIGSVDEEILGKLRRLAEDDSPLVRVAASFAFLKMGIDVGKHLGLLRRGVKHEKEAARRLAAWALGQTAHTEKWRTVLILRRALKAEKREPVRKAIGEALARLRRTDGRKNPGIV